MTIKALGTWFGSAASEADFAALYEQELPRVYNYFRYRVGDGAIAEDLTSETFEKAWAQRGRYKRDLGAFSTWVFTIARRVAVDYYRRRRPEAPLDAGLDVQAAFALEDHVSQQADYARLAAILRRLSDRDREIIALRYGAGLTNRRIAALLDLSESNVGVIVHRALAQMRAAWEERS